LSPELTKRLSEASINAIQTIEVRRRIEAEGATPVGNSPQEFAKFLDIDILRWREVVKFSGAKPE
jgi:tripartite-type tricarboxylate transporter receptor subunit TctC